MSETKASPIRLEQIALIGIGMISLFFSLLIDVFNTKGGQTIMNKIYAAWIFTLLMTMSIVAQTNDSYSERIRIWNQNINSADYPQHTEPCVFCMTDPHPLLGEYAGKDVWKPAFADPAKVMRSLFDVSPTVRMVNNGAWTSVNSFTHVLNDGKNPGGRAFGGQFALSTAQNQSLGRVSAGKMSLTALQGFMYLRSQNEAEATAIKAYTTMGGNAFPTANTTPLYGIRAYAMGGHGGTTVLETAGEFTAGSAGGAPGTIDEARGISIRVTGLPLAEISVAKGLALQNWDADNSGSYGTSYGIYADSSIDRGANRYFIYSLSTSPSFFSGKQRFDSTNISTGKTGNQTINKPSFSVNFAPNQSEVTVQNSFIEVNSNILCSIQTNDATAILKNATPAAGSVTIRLSGKATAETRVACLVTN